MKLSQTERLIKAARAYHGITRLDFLAPNVIDGGTAITNFPGRMYDAEHKHGAVFEVVGKRHGCNVFRLVAGVDGAVGSPQSQGPSTVSSSTANANGTMSTGSLFENIERKPAKSNMYDPEIV